MRRGVLLGLVLLLAAALSPQQTEQAFAQTPADAGLVSNLGQTRYQYPSFTTWQFRIADSDHGQRFTTGGNAGGYRVDSVDIELANLSDTTTFSKITVMLNGQTLTAPAFVATTAPRMYRFTAPAGGIDLLPSTTYMIVIDTTVQPSGTGEIVFTRSTALDDGSASGWTIGQRLNRRWDRANWSNVSDHFKMRVNGEPNPALVGTLAQPNGQDAPTLAANIDQADGAMGSLGDDRAQAFTTGGTGFTLSAVEVTFADLRSVSFLANVAATIRTDSSGSPGSEVGALTLPTGGSYTSQTKITLMAPAPAVGAPGGGISLAANTTYWLEFDSSAAPSTALPVNIRYTASDAQDAGGESGWTIADGSLSRSRSATDWTGSTSNAESMKIRLIGASFDRDYAQAFTTGSNATGYTLNSVDLQFSSFTIDPALPFTNRGRLFDGAIYSSVDGKPGKALGWMNARFTHSAGDVVVNFRPYRQVTWTTREHAPVELKPDTTYFFVLDLLGGVYKSAHDGVRTTASDAEDVGAEADWSIADGSLSRPRRSWDGWRGAGDFTANASNESLKLRLNGEPNELPVTIPVHQVSGDWELAPPGLKAGDEFRLIFITNNWRDATSADIADYDAHVQAQVVQAGHAEIRTYAPDFRVVGSTADVDARDHIGMNRHNGDHPNVPIYWLGGERVAANSQGFWQGTWENWGSADRRSAAGVLPNSGTQQDWHWTGTTFDGTKSVSNEYLGATTVVRGRFWVDDTTFGPIAGGGTTANTQQHSFIGISPVFQVTSQTQLPADAYYMEFRTCAGTISGSGSSATCDAGWEVKNSYGTLPTITLQEGGAPVTFQFRLIAPNGLQSPYSTRDWTLQPVLRGFHERAYVGNHYRYGLDPGIHDQDRLVCVHPHHSDPVSHTPWRDGVGTSMCSSVQPIGEHSALYPNGFDPANPDVGRVDSNVPWRTITLKAGEDPDANDHWTEYEFEPSEWRFGRVYLPVHIVDDDEWEQDLAFSVCETINSQDPTLCDAWSDYKAIRDGGLRDAFPLVLQPGATHRFRVRLETDPSTIDTKAPFNPLLPFSNSNKLAADTDKYFTLNLGHPAGFQVNRLSDVDKLVGFSSTADYTGEAYAPSENARPALWRGMAKSLEITYNHPVEITIHVPVDYLTTVGDHVRFGVRSSNLHERSDGEFPNRVHGSFNRGRGDSLRDNPHCDDVTVDPCEPRVYHRTRTHGFARTLTTWIGSLPPSMGGFEVPRKLEFQRQSESGLLGSPGSVGDLTATDLSDGGITLSWPSVAGADGYEVRWWATTSAVPEVPAEQLYTSATTEQNTYDISGLDPETEYRAVVYLRVGGETRPDSASPRLRFTTLASGAPTQASPTSPVLERTPELSISAGSGITEGGTATFTITADPAPSSPITVSIGVSESGDFGAIGAATVTVSGASTTYTITTTDDDVDEPDGSVKATLKDGDGYTVSSANGAATVTVADNDDSPAYTVDPAVVNKVKALAAQTQHGTDHVNRWNRVLVAFGEHDGTGVTDGAMTADEAQDMADAHSSPVWDEVVTELTALEAWQASQNQDEQTTPTPEHTVDPAVVNRVKALAAQTQHGTDHVNRWNRVLVAFGEHDGTGVTDGAMTADEAQDMADAHSSPVWDEVVTELTALEAWQASQSQDEQVTPTPELSISAGSGITEGGSATFTITASPAPSSPITVNVGVSESGSFGATGAATIQVSGASTTYTVTTTDDNVDEPDGSVTATLKDGSGYTVSSTNGAATVSVADNDDPPVITPVVSISGGSGITEGGTASFTITASPAPSSPITVNVGVSESGSFGATGAATVTVSGATTTYTITTTDDSTDEADGSVTATLQDGSGYTVSSTNGAATVSVADNDVPELSISAGSGITEGGSATFTITASPAPASPITVKVGVSESGSFGASGAATVTVSGASTTYTVTTTDDSTDEADGSVTATLKDGSGYTVSSTDGAATVSVADNDDAAPEVETTLTVEEASASEDDEYLEFTVRLSQASTEEITIAWNTATAWDVADDRAHGGDDYERVFKSELVFAAGVTEMTGRVRLIQDGEAEEDEYFAVELFLPGSFWPADATGIMTIEDGG